jgi:hypothetical protein
MHIERERRYFQTKDRNESLHEEHCQCYEVGKLGLVQKVFKSSMFLPRI